MTQHLIVRVVDRADGQPVAYANCKTWEEAQLQAERFNRLFINSCDIEIRRAVMCLRSVPND